MSEQLPGVSWDNFVPHMRGDYDKNGASMDAPTPNLPYRYAADIQSHVVREVEESGFQQDQAAREDIAWYYVNEELQKVVEPSELAWDAFHLWTRIYRYSGGAGRE